MNLLDMYKNLLIFWYLKLIKFLLKFSVVHFYGVHIPVLYDEMNKWWNCIFMYLSTNNTFCVLKASLMPRG